MENTEKVQNYKGGEIRRTVDSYYIFVKGDAHSGRREYFGGQHGRLPGWGWDCQQ